MPDDELILTYIHEPIVKRNWIDICDYLIENYELERRILFSGKKYGWAVQYKRKTKTIITLYPERKSFSALLVFGKRELEEISGMRAELSDCFLDKLGKTESHHDGNWMWLRYYGNDFK